MTREKAIASGRHVATSSSPDTRRDSGLWQLARVLLGLLGVLVLVGVLGQALRPQVEHLGRAFVERGGYFGMAVGTLLADGFLFPVPPQFYMLLAIASESATGWTLVSLSLGSIAGGVLGYVLSRRLARVDWLARRLDKGFRARALQDKLGSGLSNKSVLLLGLSPIAFSWLIYFCGVSGQSWRQVALLCVVRVPKLAFYLWLVRFGWAL